MSVHCIATRYCFIAISESSHTRQNVGEIDLPHPCIGFSWYFYVLLSQPCPLTFGAPLGELFDQSSFVLTDRMRQYLSFLLTILKEVWSAI